MGRAWWPIVAAGPGSAARRATTHRLGDPRASESRPYRLPVADPPVHRSIRGVPVRGTLGSRGGRRPLQRDCVADHPASLPRWHLKIKVAPKDKGISQVIEKLAGSLTGRLVGPMSHGGKGSDRVPHQAQCDGITPRRRGALYYSAYHVWTAPGVQGGLTEDGWGSRALMCPACWRGLMTAGPDGFRKRVPNKTAA